MSALQPLMEHIGARAVYPGTAEVFDLAVDSRRVKPGTLFLAREGATQDGHAYIDSAVARGASAVVVTDPTRVTADLAVPVYAVASADPAYALLAAAFYGHPTQELDVYGVTGTNGKSSTVWILDHLLRQLGQKVALISTMGYRVGEQWRHAPNTTPDALVIQRFAREAVDAGCDAMVMEVSSHGIVTGRIAGTHFRAGGFTNISRDHLDFHKSEDAYLRAKALFFSLYLRDGKGQSDAIYVDSDRLAALRTLADATPVFDEQTDNLRTLVVPDASPATPTVVAFEDHAKADVMVSSQMNATVHGYDMCIRGDGQQATGVLPLMGSFQVKNAALAITMAQRVTGRRIQELLDAVAHCPPVPGRLELTVRPREQEPAVYVDYAHSPDAIRNVLQTMRDSASSPLSIVVGCGGDRDRGKRPMMGQLAASLSDHAVLTTDNPRSEDPSAILQEMCRELPPHAHVDTIVDRGKAIEQVLEHQRGGTVVIAGKGHEDYQEILGKRWRWRDVEVARMAIAKRRFAQPDLRRFAGWSPDTLARVLEGQWHRPTLDLLWGGLSTDTRTLQRGDLFVALKGDSFDGHDHVQRAFDAGAVAAIVERPVEDADIDPQLVVASTHAALADITRRLIEDARRAEGGLSIIGITGSNGKTTTRTFATALATWMDGTAPLATRGNFNNQIGLPLSVAPMSPHQHRAMLEMGANREGDIRDLVGMAPPDVAVLTSIAPSHLAGFGSLDGIRYAKSEMVRCACPTVVIMPHAERGGVWESAAREKNAEIYTFGETEGSLLAHRAHAYAPVVLQSHTLWPGFYAEVNVPIPGVHNAGNLAAAVLATAVTPSGQMREPSQEMLRDFASMLQAPSGRMQQYQSCGRTVIYDAYNANPASMRAALQVLSEAPSPRIAVLGELFELGEREAALHQEVLQDAVAQCDIVLCVGPRWGNKGPAGVMHVQDHAQAVTDVLRVTPKGATILWKGSRGARLEVVRDKVEAYWKETGD